MWNNKTHQYLPYHLLSTHLPRYRRAWVHSQSWMARLGRSNQLCLECERKGSLSVAPGDDSSLIDGARVALRDGCGECQSAFWSEFWPYVLELVERAGLWLLWMVRHGRCGKQGGKDVATCGRRSVPSPTSLCGADGHLNRS
jgi:hypothetical protein